jgi:hypothetical protein
MVDLLAKLELANKKVLILTGDVRREVYLSCRNLPKSRVMRYADASAYDILWSDALVVEEGAIGGEPVKAPAKKAKRVAKAAKSSMTRATKAAKETAKKAAKKTAKKTAKKATKRKAAGGKKGDADA